MVCANVQSPKYLLSDRIPITVRMSTGHSLLATPVVRYGKSANQAILTASRDRRHADALTAAKA